MKDLLRLLYSAYRAGYTDSAGDEGYVGEWDDNMIGDSFAEWLVRYVSAQLAE